jgi:hypothetical protein
MGTILASFTYLNPPAFAIPRSYLWGIAIGWWHMSIVTYGNPTIIQEQPFGGYRKHIKLKDNVWEWNSNTYSLDYLLEDFYVTAPGSSTPISNGAVLIEAKPVPQYGIYCLVLSDVGADGHYMFYKLPSSTQPYWAGPFPDGLSDTFLREP